MLFILLLQTTTPQGPPYAIYATLTVGILSLIASGLNIYFSSRTAQKVINLSTKTTREVAELSAQVSRESAGLASQTARDIKETDYKHDFYKKIIAKRLVAWEEAEQFITSLGDAILDEIDGKTFHVFCKNSKDLLRLIEKMDSMMMNQTMWLGKAYGTEFMSFRNALIEILRIAMSNAHSEKFSKVNDSLVLETGKLNLDLLNKIINNMLFTLSAQIDTLHNVEDFFKEFKGARVQFRG